MIPKESEHVGVLKF